MKSASPGLCSFVGVRCEKHAHARWQHLRFETDLIVTIFAKETLRPPVSLERSTFFGRASNALAAMECVKSERAALLLTSAAPMNISHIRAASSPLMSSGHTPSEIAANHTACH
jgi:hypothetical protein